MILCQSAFELLKARPDGSVDVTITDPPFDQRTHEGQRSQGAEESAIDFPPFGPEELVLFVREALRVTRRWVIAFCSLEQLGAYQQAAGDSWIRSGVWLKPDGAPQFTGDRPAQPGEGLAIMHGPGRKRWARGGHKALWTFGVCRKDRVHPTQKPLDLMLALVSDFSEPGELVLDPFAGSGSTAIACMRLGREFIGCEIDPAMHRIAMERIEAERRGLSLTAHRSGQLGLLP